MIDTPRLGLPLLAAGQAQKHVTHNDALLGLDALVMCAVADRDLATPPDFPDEGARFIVAAGGAGAWAGQDGAVATWQDGAWRLFPPRAGFLVFVADEACLVLFDGSDWVPLGEALGSLANVSRLGIGTRADAANPFAAKLNAALMTARGVAEGGTGDLRCVLNKEAAADTLSILLQSGYAGRAEIGLIGDDDLRLKVAGDGGVWRDAVRLDRSSGVASFPSGLRIPNLSTFADVSLDNGATAYGANGFSRLPLATVTKDAGQNWDPANHWYTCPRSGVYVIAATLRVGPDGSVQGYDSAQFGLGVYTAEQDGPWFLWHFTPPIHASAGRVTYPYSRISYQNAGDRLRMFTYSDYPGGVVVYRAGLQIMLVCDDA